MPVDLLSEMRKVDALNCKGYEAVYSAAIDESPIAASVAARICYGLDGTPACPLLVACGKFGQENGYDGVWGGREGGTELVRNPQPVKVKQWVASLCRKYKDDGPALREQMVTGIPSFRKMTTSLLGEDPLHQELTSEGCLALREPNATLAIKLRRAITRDAIMLGIDALGMARIELICRNTATCISPWHMLWSSDQDVPGFQISLEGSRRVAFALFLLREGWDLENITLMTAISARDLRDFQLLIDGLESEEPFVYGNAWDMLSWAEYHLDAKLNGHQQRAVLQLIRAAEELSCPHIASLMEIGKEFY